MNRSFALRGPERAVECRRCSCLEQGLLRSSRARRCSERWPRSRTRCSRAASAPRERPLTIFIRPPPTSFLYVHERDVGSTPVVAIHHEADGPSRREHCRLCVAVAEVLAQLHRLFPFLRCAIEVGQETWLISTASRCFHRTEKRVTVPVVARERPAVIARDAGRLRVGRGSSPP